MKNLWPDKFEPESLPPPKKLLQEQCALLMKLTNGMVQAEVAPISDIETLRYSMKNDFSFRFDILGPFLENYRFTLLRLSHDIAIYPVKVLVDSDVSKELDLPLSTSGFGHFKTMSPEEFENFIQKVFQSDRVRRIVGSIIALSK